MQSQAAQDSLLSSTVQALLASNVLGCDIIEIGYTGKTGVDLAHHIGLWDVLSRNARFLTGNGVSDDHVGSNWLRYGNNWITQVWSPSKSESDLLAAMRAGRAWCGSLSRFRGGLDLLADGMCPMGSASVSALNTRQVTVIATGLPNGSKVEVVRGVCDYTGTTQNTANVKTLVSKDLAYGSTTVTVDTSTSCFVRTQVRNSTGVVIAVSNPVWLLRETPPTGIPVARRLLAESPTASRCGLHDRACPGAPVEEGGNDSSIA